MALLCIMQLLESPLLPDSWVPSRWSSAHCSCCLWAAGRHSSRFRVHNPRSRQHHLLVAAWLPPGHWWGLPSVHALLGGALGRALAASFTSPAPRACSGGSFCSWLVSFQWSCGWTLHFFHVTDYFLANWLPLNALYIPGQGGLTVFNGPFFLGAGHETRLRHSSILSLLHCSYVHTG